MNNLYIGFDVSSDGNPEKLYFVDDKGNEQVANLKTCDNLTDVLYNFYVNFSDIYYEHIYSYGSVDNCLNILFRRIVREDILDGKNKFSKDALVFIGFLAVIVEDYRQELIKSYAFNIGIDQMAKKLKFPEGQNRAQKLKTLVNMDKSVLEKTTMFLTQEEIDTINTNLPKYYLEFSKVKEKNRGKYAKKQDDSVLKATDLKTGEEFYFPNRIYAAQWAMVFNVTKGKPSSPKANLEVIEKIRKNPDTFGKMKWEVIK